MALKDEETLKTDAKLSKNETLKTDAKLSKNDVQIEVSLTNNNGEGETAHTENDLSEMD